MSAYDEYMNRKLGPIKDGEERYSSGNLDELIQNIKERLVDTSNCVLWTFGHTDEEIVEVDRLLTEADIVHCHDAVIGGFVCFTSQSRMIDFYINIANERPEHGE